MRPRASSSFRHASLLGLALFGVGCGRGGDGQSGPRYAVRAAAGDGTTVGPPPSVEFSDQEKPSLSAAQQFAEQRARAFASTFFFSEFPQVEQAPAENASYGGIGEQAFAIERIELWPRGRDFVVRAATGGACGCLGLEWIVSGPLEPRGYVLQDNNARGFFRVPRTGSSDLLVRQVQTQIVQAPANGVLLIDKVERDQNGTLRSASGRFVYTQQEGDDSPRVWSAGRFEHAKVEPFEP